MSSFGDIERASLMAKRAELALTLEGMRLMKRDQERQQMAKRYHIPDDLTPYLPPIEFVNEVQKQHDAQCRQAVDAALAKKQQSFWDGWFAATKALSR